MKKFLGTRSNIVFLPRGFTKDTQIAREKLLISIVDEHDGAMRRFLRMQQLSKADQEDVLQDVYLKLSNMEDIVERLKKNPDTIRSYLFVVATNVIRDNARRAVVREVGKHQPLEEKRHMPNRLAGGASPEAIIGGRQTAKLVQKVLWKQKTVHRQAFVLSRVEHKSYREIADVLSVSISTVEKYISRVLFALRQELE